MAGKQRSVAVLLALLAFMPTDEATDTLFQGQSLSGNQTIVSKGGVFELGFFRPGTSTRFYVGIWYKGITPQTVVWVANRAAPVFDRSACRFKISDDGRSLILLLIGSNKILWPASLYNTSFSNGNDTISSFAVLQDNGNLVLKKSKDAATAIVWQSFDHPTDTYLPEAPLGRNNTTGETQKLVAWKSYDDPAPGRYSYGLDPRGTPQYLLTWNGSLTYWSSGRWVDSWFEKVPEMEPASKFCNFTFVNNNNWTSFYYSNIAHGHNTTRRVLDSATGQLRQYQWVDNPGRWIEYFFSPKSMCQAYALCGSFGVCVMDNDYCRCLDGFEPASPGSWSKKDWSDGCVRRMPLRCHTNGGSTGNVSARGQEDKFKALPNMRLPVNPQKIIGREINDDQDCKFACLNYQISNNSDDCSCTAYFFQRGVCLIWIGDLLNLQRFDDGDHAGETLQLRVAAVKEMPKKTSDIDRAGMFIGFATSVVVILVAIGSVLLHCKRKARRVLKRLRDGSLVMFSYRHLQSATKNFSEELGAGGFGSVFRGDLPDTTAVAVKKLGLFQQGEKQFRAEVSTLGKVQHLNVVRLRGFCCSGHHRLLVYEFMPNGSLDRYLFGGHPDMILSWRTRYQIMLGVARGLAYLHDDCYEQIVHCDVKPENILLGVDYCPKVADFGMAKLIGRDFSRALTTLRGTRGYLAPEWIAGLPITSKADVYSYGMLLLELVSGKRNSCELRVGDAHVYRPLWAVTRVCMGRASELADAVLEGDFNEEELERACRVACWCIQDSEDNRPSMKTIVQVLVGVVDLRIPPIPNALLHLNEEPNTVVFYYSERSSLISGVTEHY